MGILADVFVMNDEDFQETLKNLERAIDARLGEIDKEEDKQDTGAKA